MAEKLPGTRARGNVPGFFCLPESPEQIRGTFSAVHDGKSPASSQAIYLPETSAIRRFRPFWRRRRRTFCPPRVLMRFRKPCFLRRFLLEGCQVRLTISRALYQNRKNRTGKRVAKMLLDKIGVNASIPIKLIGIV